MVEKYRRLMAAGVLFGPHGLQVGRNIKKWPNTSLRSANSC